MKYVHTTKELASRFKVNINYMRTIAKNYLKKKKIGNSYIFTRHDIEKLKDFFRNQ